MQLRIGLVGQPKRRRGGICRACEQFEPSIVFRRARDLCSREYREWYIVSTTYGIVAPHQVIGPEAPALHTLSAMERALWAQRVAGQLRERLDRSQEPITFVLYANQQYADLLQRAAPRILFELPLAGLSLPEKLRWYDDRLSIHRRVLP
ncbi:MAG: DUF6884 domain-containing protein [Ktedonobacterales bacterium]